MYAFCMALNIKDPKADQVVRRLAAATGESITEAVTRAAVERLTRLGHQRRDVLVADIAAIALRCAALPEVDGRADDDIIGYDEHGIPS